MGNRFLGFGRGGTAVLILTQVLACSSSRQELDHGGEQETTGAREAGPGSVDTLESSTAQTTEGPAATSSEATASSSAADVQSTSSETQSVAETDLSAGTVADSGVTPDCKGCFVSNQCWQAGALAPGNPCAVCQPETSTTRFSPVSALVVCDDADPCTTNDVCGAGQCVGTVKVCDDGVGCNGVETCNTESGACERGASTCTSGVCDVNVDTCVVDCANGCLVDGICHAAGAGPTAALGCWVCDPEQSTIVLVPNSGASCDVAADYCVSGGICNDEGACEPQPKAAGTACGPNDDTGSNGTLDGGGWTASGMDAGSYEGACSVSTCDGAGQCVTAFVDEGVGCDDGHIHCHEQNQCDGMGGCILGDPMPLGSVCEGGTCAGDPERPECGCPPGTEGELGSCIDIDECALNLATCDRAPDACINEWGSYRCECPGTFTGDGQGEEGCPCARDEYSPLCLPWTMVSSAHLSTCAISGGALFCWGENVEGELGTGDKLGRATPARVGTANDWESVTTGFSHSCGIRDGSLYCWGKPGAALGHNGTGLTPGRVGTDTDWTSVAVGTLVTCGIRGAGQLYCWGLNGSGAMGLGTATLNTYTTPQRVTSFDGFTKVEMFFSHACALLAGSLLCWGEAYPLETADRLAPELVSSITDFTDVDIGTSGACATRASGALYCWEDTLEPVEVPDRSDWATISTASGHFCGLNQSGGAFCWGHGGGGELGAGPLVYTTEVPVAVNGFESWSQIEAGQRVTYGIHDGGLYAWGANEAGLRGTGAKAGRVGAASDWTSLSTGLRFSCGIRTPGELYCWGLVPPGTAPSAPVRIGTDSDWTLIDVGWGHACGIRATGELYCFGDNESGELGDGTTTDRAELVRVGTDTDWTHVSVSGGTETGYTCGIGALGQLRCWGANGFGQLGDGSTSRRTAPVNVGGVEWTAISVGAGATCGVRVGGLYCWGDASSGKIGTAASSGTRTTPLRIGSSSTWTAVSSGFSFGCGIDAGTPHCWGSTTFGALGVGSTQSTLKTPTAVAAPGTFVAIDSGTFFSCALRNDGALHCWGDNQYGQAGTSDVSTQLLAPGAAHTSMSFESISANYSHACGLSNGAAYCWGNNLRDLTNTGDGFNLTPVANGL